MSGTALTDQEITEFKQAVAAEIGVEDTQLTEFEVTRANHQGYKYKFSSKQIQIDRMRTVSGFGDREDNRWLVVIETKSGWLS